MSRPAGDPGLPRLEPDEVALGALVPGPAYCVPGCAGDGLWLPRETLWPELGRAVGEVLGRTDGTVLGRTLGAEGREGLGLAEGREEPPEGRGPALEPREPWLTEDLDGLAEGRLAEGREAPAPLEPREGEAEGPEDPLDPRCGAARDSPAGPRTRSASPRRVAMRVFMARWGAGVVGGALQPRSGANGMPAPEAPSRGPGASFVPWSGHLGSGHADTDGRARARGTFRGSAIRGHSRRLARGLHEISWAQCAGSSGRTSSTASSARAWMRT
jgi:hypothetical protein